MADQANIAGGQAPGGLSWGHFKAMSAECGTWLWGTVRGAFNEKASFSQIIVDAVIGMIPLVGDVTAARDLVAVTISMVDDPKKSDDVMEWVLLVVLLFALIPVIGGVIKGVGRLVIKLAREASALTDAQRTAHMAKGVREIMAFLNRIGHLNAEQWFVQLKAATHQAELLEHFNKLLAVIAALLTRIRTKVGVMMPAGMAARIDALLNGLKVVKATGAQMIPKAIKELDQQLMELQSYVRSGGETTSRLVHHEVATGQRVVTRAEEARLIEEDALPIRTMGGWKKNDAIALDPKTYRNVYAPAPGYPDLTKDVRDGHHTQIEAFSGRIVNRPLKEGEQIYRFFGPDGVTHRVNVDASNPGGGWWGLGSPPRSANEWRGKAAVLDEWNRDGFTVVGTIPAGADVKAAVGTISEQSGNKIPGQYLPGGSLQAVIDLPSAAKDGLSAIGRKVLADGKPRSWIDPTTGISFEIRPTGWTDANGVHGYVRTPGPGAVQAVKLTEREVASKENKEVTK